jgi:hypothetical protein
MGKARKIVIRTRSFEKAGDATAFFKTMLNSYSVGQVVSGSDTNDLHALLERHDEKSEKVGVGISYFKVDSAPDPYGGKCFWIVRVDGTEIDFSYPHCLEPKPSD